MKAANMRAAIMKAGRVARGSRQKTASRIVAAFLTTILGACAGSRPEPCEVDDVVPPPVEPGETRLQKPKIVVWITVDQMRGDYFRMYRHHFGDSGFRRLFEEGAWYQNAHYRHAITETAPGHATLFTGASPREHGIVANYWLGPDGTPVASVHDPEFPLLGPGVPAAMSDADRAKKGGSPRSLLLPTLADALTQSTQGRGRVVSVSSKDRGAILPGGFSGSAIWLGPSGFVSSSYYGDEVKCFLDEHHEEHPPKGYLEEGWKLTRDEAEYRNPPSTSKLAQKMFGEAMPYEFEGKEFSSSTLKAVPFGDRAVLDLARSAIEEWGLGEDQEVDLLAVSLSSTDYIGHVFGPESRQFEDHLLRLDAWLADFFVFVDSQVGTERVLYVLSADHGGSASAGSSSEKKLPGKNLTIEQIEAAAKELLRTEFADEKLLRGVVSPYVYLDEELIAKKKLDRAEVRAAVARALESVEGVRRAYPIDAVDQEGSELSSLVEESTHPDRSGDIYIVPEPYTLLLQDAGVFATHGSPWSYDTHVPVVLSGLGIQAQSVSELVDVRQLAPTVAALSDVLPPAGARQGLLPRIE